MSLVQRARCGNELMDCPRDDSHGHTLRAFLDAKPRVRVIVDLSSDLDNYDVDGRIVRHKVPLVAKSVPSAADVSRFIDLVQASNRMSHVRLLCCNARHVIVGI